MRYVYKHNVDLFVKFATRVWGVDLDFDNPERTALEGIERLKCFFRSLGLPVTLRGAGHSIRQAGRNGIKMYQG